MPPDISGILGLARPFNDTERPNTNFLGQLILQNLYTADQQCVTWDLTNETSPVIDFGGSYSNIYSQYLPTVEHELADYFWTVAVNCLTTSNGLVKAISSEAIIDTGSVFAYFPPIYYNMIKTDFEA